MEQKISKYKPSSSQISYEIVGELLRKENHARSLAKKLGTNHMTINRKLRKLSEDNVVDSQLEGRNKIYYLKKTLEARGHTVMAELYKLEKTLRRYPELRKIAEKIQKKKKIKLAMFFGSYSKGTASKASDIDLYVETQNIHLKKELENLNSKLQVKIGRYNPKNPLFQEIDKDHIIIKGAERYYEKKEFFLND